MEYWVSKQNKKDAWKIFRNEDFGFDIFEKGQILRGHGNRKKFEPLVIGCLLLSMQTTLL